MPERYSTSTPDTKGITPQAQPTISRQTIPPAVEEGQHLHARLNRQEELCLVHHYTTLIHLGNTSKDSSAEPKIAAIWRDMPFHDGLTYEFVLDAVLAVAALHKAFTEPQHSKKYIAACISYQNQCLSGYQEQLTNINDANCHAVFAVSALVHVLNTAMSCGGPGLPPTPPIETLLSQIKLGRGIRIVLNSAWETVKSAHYKDILTTPGAKTPLGAVNSPEVVCAMDELRRCATEAQGSETTVPDVYIESIDSLENAFKHVEQGEDLGAITVWSILLDDAAAALIDHRDPLMMLICIHYGVLCLHIHDRWWAHNFGCRLIWDLSELLHALDASWLPLTSWARSKAASACAASVKVELW